MDYLKLVILIIILNAKVNINLVNPNILNLELLIQSKSAVKISKRKYTIC